MSNVDLAREFTDMIMNSARIPGKFEGDNCCRWDAAGASRAEAIVFWKQIEARRR